MVSVDYHTYSEASILFIHILQDKTTMLGAVRLSESACFWLARMCLLKWSDNSTELLFHFHFILQCNMVLMLAVICLGRCLFCSDQSAVTDLSVLSMWFSVDTGAVNIVHVDGRNMLIKELLFMYSCKYLIHPFLWPFFCLRHRKMMSPFLNLPTKSPMQTRDLLNHWKYWSCTVRGSSEV